MSEVASHKAKAERFLALFNATDPAHREMRVIALFYSAVHLVEMVAAAENPPISNNDHLRRHNYLRTEHPKAWRQYKPLNDLAWSVRYDAREPLVDENAIAQYYRARLRSLELWAMEKLGGEYAISTPKLTVAEEPKPEIRSLSSPTSS